MQVVALVVMLVATATLLSALATQRKRAALVPVRIKRDRR